MVSLAIRPYRRTNEMRREVVVETAKRWIIMLIVMIVVSLLVSSWPWVVYSPIQKAKETRSYDY
jgi:hypothetical protein